MAEKQYDDTIIEDILSVFGNIEAILHYMVSYQRFDFSVETMVPNSDDPVYLVEFKLGSTQYYRSEWEFNLTDAIKSAFTKYVEREKQNEE